MEIRYFHFIFEHAEESADNRGNAFNAPGLWWSVNLNKKRSNHLASRSDKRGAIEYIFKTSFLCRYHMRRRVGSEWQTGVRVIHSK